MSDFTLRVRDFRVIKRMKWCPKGLCVLVSANGAGKSTVLDVLRFLRVLFQRGSEAAFATVGSKNFSRWGAETPVEFCIETENLVWKLFFPVSDHAVCSYGEELYRGNELVLHADLYRKSWYLGSELQTLDEPRCCAKMLWDRGTVPWLKPLVDALGSIQTYTYGSNPVKEALVSGRDAYLNQSTGCNLWSILANWKGSPLRNNGQFDWVRTEARKAFPDIFGDIEFDRGVPYIFRPGASNPSQGLPPTQMADGLLMGLLHLTAVAEAKPGSLLFFDNIENHLHPHALRQILAAMRQQAEERELTIVLTTHSSVVLNQFCDTPEQVYVLGHGATDVSWHDEYEQHPEPAPLTALHSEEWLAQAKLGSLYEKLGFGSPLGDGIDEER